MSENSNFFEQCCDESFAKHFCEFVGETVTVFTESGGVSGCGFTGVLIKVNPCFIRLITCVGPAPGCAVGSSCGPCRTLQCRREPFRNVGSVADIPIDKIVAFVHNAI